MKIKLVKEKKDMYYAELQGNTLTKNKIYSQGETPQQAIINLGYVYEMVAEHEADLAKNQSVSFSSLKNNYMQWLDTLRFRSLTISV